MGRLHYRALAWRPLIAVLGGLSLVSPALAVSPAPAARGADQALLASAAKLGAGADRASAAFPWPLRGADRSLAVRSHGGPAAAAGLPPATPSARAGSAMPSAGAGPTISSNPGYAGYEVDPTAGSPVAVSFVVPTLACPSNRYFGTIPGVLAGGIAYLGAGVALECYGGKPHYTAVSFYNGPFDDLGPVVHPGDSISVSVSDDSSSSEADLSDVTTGAFGVNTYPGFSMSYADVGDDSEYNYYTPLGVPSFGSVAFTGATVGGKKLGSLSPAGESMGDGTTTLVQTSAIGSDKTSFTTSYQRSLFPTTVQGRVIEGLSGQQTLAATVWPVTFTSTASSSASAFTATIYWGDGSSSTGSVSSVAAANCTYSPLAPVGTCFAVTGRHTYGASGDYVVYVLVTGPGGDTAAGTGIAEIVDSPASAPATDSIGVLTWSTGSGYEECTATALAGLDAVLTAQHCGLTDSDIEFAPQHTGNCGSGSNIMSISECEAPSGPGHDPLGYWTGTGFLTASDSDSHLGVNAGADTDLVLLNDTSSTGYSLVSDVGGLPIHFDPPHGKLTFNAYGYPGRVGNWSLQKCLGAKDVSDSSDTVIGIMPCDFGYVYPKKAGGASGGPYVSSDVLPDAISATNIGVCPANAPEDFCVSLNWPHSESENTAVGNLMSNNAMQVYLVAILGMPQP